MNYIIFVIILLILILNFHIINKNLIVSDENFISFNISEQLRGLAIVLVIISHLILIKCISINLITLKYIGAYGVSIFLILSGYGLTESYKRDRKLSNFYIKRIKKVVLPYSLVTVVWILIDSIILKKSYLFNDLILVVIGFDFKRTIDPSMWYITFILLWYIIFWITFKLPFRNIIKVFILFLCAYIFNKYSRIEYTKSIAYQFILHSYGFPIGVLMSLYIKKITNVFKCKMLISIISIFTIFLLIVYRYTLMNINVNINYYGANSIIFALISLCIFILVSFVNIKFKIFAYLGSLSYELYLLEFVFLTKYPIFSIFKNKLLSLAVYIIILILLSYVIRHSTNMLIKWNKEGLKKDYK